MIRRGHETRDADLRAVYAFLLILVFSAVIIHLALWWWLRGGLEVTTRQRASLVVKAPARPPRPRILGAPDAPPPGPQELRTLREAEDYVLRSYGWVDRQAGVARIPIQRAMEIIAERGLPVPGGAGPGGAEAGP